MASNLNKQPTFEETLQWYLEERSQVQKKKVKKFEEKEAKAKAAKEKAAKGKATKGKHKQTWRQKLANMKRKLAWEEKEDSSDDEFLDFDYDNLNLSFDLEKSPKFSL